MNIERIQYWISEGAQVTNVSRFLEAADLDKKRRTIQKSAPGQKAQDRVEEKLAKDNEEAPAAEEAPAEEAAADEAPQLRKHQLKRPQQTKRQQPRKHQLKRPQQMKRQQPRKHQLKRPQQTKRRSRGSTS